MFNLNVSVAHLHYPLAGILGFPSALSLNLHHTTNQENKSNYVGQEQKEHNGTTVTGVEFWREESWSECMYALGEERVSRRRKDLSTH